MSPVLPRYWDQPIREASRAAVGTAQMLGPLGSRGLSASTPQAKGPRAAGSGCAQPTCKPRPARAGLCSALPEGSATEAKVVGLPRLAHATPKTRAFEKKRRVSSRSLRPNLLITQQRKICKAQIMF